eukprot:1137218-Pelagomonas_calceolata.AAC.4
MSSLFSIKDPRTVSTIQTFAYQIFYPEQRAHHALKQQHTPSREFVKYPSSCSCTLHTYFALDANAVLLYSVMLDAVRGLGSRSCRNRA